MADLSARAGREDSSQVNLALGFAAATVVLFVVFSVADIDGPIWLLIAGLGVVTAILGWRAGRGSRPTGRALIAVAVGVIAFLLVMGWAVVDAVG